MPSEINLTELARRWLGKPVEQVDDRVADRVARFGGSWPFIGCPASCW